MNFPVFRINYFALSLLVCLNIIEYFKALVNKPQYNSFWG